uniref:Uncharacterized protein n=1 Tax=Rhizophora mucronata TaxID=61149 RepID=A0A2P2IR68_RHIMU
MAATRDDDGEMNSLLSNFGQIYEVHFFCKLLSVYCRCPFLFGYRENEREHPQRKGKFISTFFLLERMASILLLFVANSSVNIV